MSHTLLGEWGFLDNLDDTSGNGLDATVNFTPTYIDGPTVGTRAIRFSDDGQTITYGRTGLEPATGGVVTMAWAQRYGDVFGFTPLVRKIRVGGGSRRSDLAIHDNQVSFLSRWADQLFNNDTIGTFTANAWHHVCNVDSDDRAAWFIDGVLVDQSIRGGSSSPSWESFPWLSGEDNEAGSTSSDPNVSLTGVRIFQGTMTDAEVISWMNTPVVPDTGRSGKPKVWNGTSWVGHPAKYWNGSAWVIAPMTGYDGTGFITSK